MHRQATRAILLDAIALLGVLSVEAWSASDVGRPARHLTGEEALAELYLIQRTIDRIHPGAERYQTRADLEAWYARLNEIAAPGVDDVDWYLEVSRFAASLRCGHSRVESPPRLARYRAEHPTHLPFHFVLFDGRMFVDKVAPGCEALRTRDEVTRIDGRPVSVILEEVGQTVVLDGFTDSIRHRRLQEPYEFKDSGLDHYYPLFYGMKDYFAVDVVAPDGATRTVTVEAITLDRWTKMLEPGVRDFTDAVSVRRLDERTTLLRVDTFVNYRRPVDPVERLAPIFEQLHEDDVDHLILDLRECGGGSTEVHVALARFLLDEPFVMGRPPLCKAIRVGDLEEHLSTWVENAFHMPEELFRELDDGWFEVGPKLADDGSTPVNPHPACFLGDVTVLTGPRNASGATILIAKLVDEGRIRVVGESTGGSAEGPTAGLIAFLELPHSGIRMNIPMMLQRVAIDDFEPGMGVAPDVLVEPTADDHFEGRDPVLEAALSH